MSNSRLSALGKGLEVVFTSIPDVRVATVSVGVRILPEALVGPTTRDGTHGAGVASQDERIVLAKGSAASSASIPPIGSGIDHRVSTRLAPIRLAKVFDPGDHRRCAQPVAGRAGGIVFNVQHSRQGNAIVGPPSPVSQEEIGLGGARAGVGVGKVVATTDEPSIRGTGVMARKATVNVSGAFGCLVYLSESGVGFNYGKASPHAGTNLDHDKTGPR